MCKCAVVARCSGEQVQHPVDALDGCFARDPATLGCHDDRHDPEAGSADGGFVVRCVCTCSTPIGCETTDRMAPVPEKLESLALHDLEQLLIGQFGQRCGFHEFSPPLGFDSRFCPVSATICFFADGFDESEREIAVTDDPGGEAGAAHHDCCRLCRHGTRHRG